MRTVFREFLRNESGATAVEYGLIAGLISVVIILSLKTLGTKINTKLTNIAGALN